MSKAGSLSSVACAVAVAAAAAQAAGLPPATCSGPIWIGTGSITVDPDRGDGVIHGRATYARGGVPAPIEFTGAMMPDGATLYRPNGTVWYSNITITNGRLTGTWRQQGTARTLQVDWPCSSQNAR